MKTAEEILNKTITGDENDGHWFNGELGRKEALQAMHEYASQSRWVKVSERLPEVGERVLVYNTVYGVQIGWLMFTGNWEHYTQMLKSENNTHWQPLPTPPKD